jgi:hypothetical protein
VTNKSRDVFADSFYYRAIRTRIGEELRTRLVPTEPARDRILKALQALDQVDETKRPRKSSLAPRLKLPRMIEKCLRRSLLSRPQGFGISYQGSHHATKIIDPKRFVQNSHAVMEAWGKPLIPGDEHEWICLRDRVSATSPANGDTTGRGALASSARMAFVPAAAGHLSVPAEWQ